MDDAAVRVDHLAVDPRAVFAAQHRHDARDVLGCVEAHRLVLGGGLAASQAAMRVGYASASQFTREYCRFFGQPPRQDAKRDRAQRA